ncbi:MAG: hypothetical protein NC923_04250 [Candidatus Omnitrophica bacterium]|nr:hypothetical protein [Candidatus Omnitrophota bacterium]
MTVKQKKQQKELLDKLHTKYYGKKKPKAQDPNAPGKAPEKPKASSNQGPSRNELMLQAKAKGVKNFRVLNKEELVEILKEDTTQERISEIVTGAVDRWKAGWGKGNNRKSKES